ncbi:MAG TPA: hotdog domain-containing protein [Feifaniaceae bacterium]|nr:hotdog domain-containing protein [Feifaniaceae bacterium]
MQLQNGMTGRAELTVTHADTALALGSGLLPVLSTPRLVALMEQAACAAVEGAMEPNKTTVGVRIDIRHTAATPLNMRAWAEAELVAVEGRALTFRIEAFDEAGGIAIAGHQRVVVDSERFMKKAEAKAK